MKTQGIYFLFDEHGIRALRYWDDRGYRIVDVVLEHPATGEQVLVSVANTQLEGMDRDSISGARPAAAAGQ